MFKNVFYISTFALVMLFSSCGDAAVFFEENKEISNQSWSQEDIITFEFDIDDTVQRYDFFLNLRTTTSYEFSNIYIFTELVSPTLIAKDTIGPLLAEQTGRWLGEESGSMVENNIWFMTNVRFTETGHYKILFEQGMRKKELAEIVNIGLTIKKVKD